MDMHQNDRLTPRGRAELVRRVLLEGQAPQAVARALGVNVKTVSKWGERFRAEGAAGLVDRSSRPHRLRQPTPEATVEQIAALRRQRWTGDQIAQEVGVSPATVSRVLRRRGLSRLKDLAPAAPIRRYQRASPGELIHLDIKKLGRFERIGHRITGERSGQSRGVGWEFVHVCLDDASRIAFAQVRPDERKESAVAFLQAALAYYASLGVSVLRVMTDNGSCYRSQAFAKACRRLGLKHLRTRPYTSRQGGALHPIRPQGTGLRPGLSDLGPPRRGAASLAPPLQLASPARRHTITDAHQPTRTPRGQPVEAPQLGATHWCGRAGVECSTL
jgi:transposase